MHRFAQNIPCYLMVPGFPISFTVLDNIIIPRVGHFAGGSRFSCERIENTYYLKYEGNYITFINNLPVVVEEIFTLNDLIYIEPYFNGIFYPKYKYEYLRLNMRPIFPESPVKLQWAIFDNLGSNYESNNYMNVYNFSGSYQYDNISVDGFNLLDPVNSFFLIPDGDFTKYLDCNQVENLFKFIRFDYNISIRLKFTESSAGITMYSEDFGYLQAEYDEDNETHFPVFSRKRTGLPIILEQAMHFTTFYLKYDSSYIKLIHLNGTYYGNFIEGRDEASIFQAISNY
jgi:hypothetical protein